jgi:CHAT domain-containing protein/uncharacterized protein HemY
MLARQQRGRRRFVHFLWAYRRGAGLWHGMARRAHGDPRLQPDPAFDQVSWKRQVQGATCDGQREQQRPGINWWIGRRWWRLAILTATAALVLPSCGGRRLDPQLAYDHANQALLHGHLKQAEDETHREGQRYRDSSAEWGYRFRTLEARAVLQQGHYDDALKILSAAPLPSNLPELATPALALMGEANLELHDFTQAENLLSRGTAMCETSPAPGCGYILKARGLLAAEGGHWDSAEQLYGLTLSFARSDGDHLLESHALLNLGNASLAQARYDEAIDRSEDGYRAATIVGAVRLQLITRANIGWAYYKLGDYEKALELMTEAESLASRLGDRWTQANQLTNIGYVYMDERKFDLAAQSFQKALALAQATNAKAFVYNAVRVLARLSLQTGDLASADKYVQQALGIARQDNNHTDELYPLLVQGEILARRGDPVHAEAAFQQVERDKICPVFLKWEAEHSLARLYEIETHPDRAEQEYRAALATFESARDTVRHEDSQLSFLTNAARIYDDYVHFLIAQNEKNDALRWADYSRARTLTEGLGLLPKGASIGPAPLNAQQISRRANGAILFYWLGETQSYLWAITPQQTNLFTLPARAQIEASVQHYRESLEGPQDTRESSGRVSDSDGLWLYRTLIAPARPLLKQEGKVFVIPDGALNNLNFETLIVDGAKRHYWIEDADVVNASSLRLLEASPARDDLHQPILSKSVLIIGDSVAPSSEYPELPRAADQINSVARHFPAAEERIITREQATPRAYLDVAPERYSYIHFVAHGTSSRLSPLDSAIVLSKSPTQPDSFKLYAREIVPHTLHAHLVTVSACYSAGNRAYAGEGLVGLAWAFLRAGAHNVIAGLWDVTDASTDQLMDRFYDEIEKGASVDVALRTAKLSLLRGNTFNNPFYWAPFQLYTGS